MTRFRRNPLYMKLRRVVDYLFAMAFLLLSIPVWLVSARQAARLLRATRRLITGERSIVGPSRPLVVNGRRLLCKGIISDARLSRMMNIEFSREELDAAYYMNCGPKKDLALLIRGIWILLVAGEPGDTPLTQHFSLFDVVVNNSEFSTIIATIEDMTRSHPNAINQMLAEVNEQRDIEDAAPPAHVCFVNANNFNLALERPAYMRILRDADLVLPDGIGVKLALRMAGGRLRKNLNGTDLLPFVLDMLVKNDWPLFLLGAEPEVLARAKANMEQQHPGLKICGSQDGYFQEDDEGEICERIVKSGTFVLIIGMGTPRQELWAARNLGRLSIPLVLSMGGLLDFVGEKNKRAPMWMRQAGLEWVYRILQEPKRMWRRYVIGNPLFLWRASRWIQAADARR